MDTSTSAYRLMELIAISGECSPRVLAHLHLSTSYGEKLITRLKKEGCIRTHYKDGLRGYRLTGRGKKLLLGENPARFSFYLSGSSDTNQPRSEYPRRLRLQQASIAYAPVGVCLAYRADEAELLHEPPDLLQVHDHWRIHMEQVHMDALRTFFVASYFAGFKNKCEIPLILFLSPFTGWCGFYPGVVPAA